MSTELTKHTLEQTLLIVEAMVPLLIRSGIGYSEFAAACKPVFYRQALIEAKRTQQKTTDSAISLLSGLHRRDTANLRKAIFEDPSLANPPISQPVSVPKQVIARWLSMDIGDVIDIQEGDNSFAALVAQVSKDQHFRSILTELERVGIVVADANTVTLKRNAYTPDPSVKEARELLAQNVADHIAAGVTNLFADVTTGDKGVLEQAIFSDELSEASITELHTLSNELWFKTLDTLLKRAIILHEQDQVTFEHDTDNQMTSYRFRLGMYAYHEPEQNSPEG